MAFYNLFIKKSAEKEIRRLPEKERKRVVERILMLKENPRPLGSEKLRGDDAFRLRQGDYRIIYEVDDPEKTVTVIRVGHRREVYR